MHRKSLLVFAGVCGALLAPATASAQASDPFLGQIVAVAYTFCPRGWANADGQLLRISQNSALFSLLGTTYGGDGRTTFALPDLRGRALVHTGTNAAGSFPMGSGAGTTSTPGKATGGFVTVRYCIAVTGVYPPRN